MKDICPFCKKEFNNYNDPVLATMFCSVGCEARAYSADLEEDRCNCKNPQTKDNGIICENCLGNVDK